MARKEDYMNEHDLDVLYEIIEKEEIEETQLILEDEQVE